MDKKLQGIKIIDELYEPKLTNSKVYGGKLNCDHDIEITYEISNNKIYSGRFTKNIESGLLTNTIIIRKLKSFLSLAGSLYDHTNNFNSGNVNISKNLKVYTILRTSNINEGIVNSRISGDKILDKGTKYKKVILFKY